MTITVTVGPEYHTGEDVPPLHLDAPITALAERMLRTALAIAGDPDGKRTFRADIGEGVVELRMWTSYYSPGFLERETETVTVDVIQACVRRTQ
jgi:hypothetical protein